jgi:hypothetical protein
MSNNLMIASLGRSKMLMLVITMMGLSVLILASGRILWPSNKANDQAITPDSTASQQKLSALIESELITVTRRGFEPGTIVRPQGKFILMIENATLQNLDLRFSREAGQSLNELRATRDEPDWNEIMDLNPGRYVLKELNHPEWTCIITIEAH